MILILGDEMWKSRMAYWESWEETKAREEDISKQRGLKTAWSKTLGKALRRGLT